MHSRVETPACWLVPRTAHGLDFPYDGSDWREISVSIDQSLWDVWPSGPDSCLVVGPDDPLAVLQLWCVSVPHLPATESWVASEGSATL